MDKSTYKTWYFTRNFQNKVDAKAIQLYKIQNILYILETSLELAGNLSEKTRNPESSLVIYSWQSNDKELNIFSRIVIALHNTQNVLVHKIVSKNITNTHTLHLIVSKMHLKIEKNGTKYQITFNGLVQHKMHKLYIRDFFNELPLLNISHIDQQIL